MKILIQTPVLLIVLICTCCSLKKANWDKGTIIEAGIYNAKNIQLIVEVENNLVDFKVFDHAGNPLLQNPHNFSDLHRWALYLDKDESIWVLSSDIGHYVFRKNPTTGEYQYSQFSHFLEKNDVPEYMYNDLKSFVSFR